MEIPDEILYEAIDAMMSAPLYMSENTWPEDFKPEKWEPYRDEAAEQMGMAHLALLYAMVHASGTETGCPATNTAGEVCCYSKGHSERLPHRFVKEDE